jgi:hypothetical protein
VGCSSDTVYPVIRPTGEYNSPKEKKTKKIITTRCNMRSRVFVTSCFVSLSLSLARSVARSSPPWTYSLLFFGEETRSRESPWLFLFQNVRASDSHYRTSSLSLSLSHSLSFSTALGFRFEKCIRLFFLG